MQVKMDASKESGGKERKGNSKGGWIEQDKGEGRVKVGSV